MREGAEDSGAEAIKLSVPRAAAFIGANWAVVLIVFWLTQMPLDHEQIVQLRMYVCVVLPPIAAYCLLWGVGSWGIDSDAPPLSVGLPVGLIAVTTFSIVYNLAVFQMRPDTKFVSDFAGLALMWLHGVLCCVLLLRACDDGQDDQRV